MTPILLLGVDGVLVTLPAMSGSSLLAQHPEAARAFFYGPFIEASTARADLRDHLPALLAQIGCAGSADDFLRGWLAFGHHLNAPLIEAVRGLCVAGWQVYLATNQERWRVACLLSDMGLEHLVEGEFASCTVGRRKPDPLYLAEVARRLNAPPSDPVFWNDAPPNVEAGWTAHLYADVDHFRQVMGPVHLSLEPI